MPLKGLKSGWTTKSQILQETTQTQWTISKIVPQTTRLQFDFMTHSRKDKHKSRYSVKK